MYTWLDPNRLYMDYGPIQMTISAFYNDEPLKKEVEEACHLVAEHLKKLSSFLPIAKLSPVKIKEERQLPDILKKMINAVRDCGDLSLTPMSAVAGAFADIAADFIAQKGATKVLVNNGGDIALRLASGQFTKVGIVSDINANSFSHEVVISADSGIGGIATSGFGGRGFTKGIASAAVAFGKTGALADVAATLIGNCTYTEDPQIKQVPAEQLDLDTDIAGHLVTVSIGNLNPQTIDKALANSGKKIKELVDKEVIIGSAVFLNDKNFIFPITLADKVKLH